jgi:hypothetical protein
VPVSYTVNGFSFVAESPEAAADLLKAMGVVMTSPSKPPPQAPQPEKGERKPKTDGGASNGATPPGTWSHHRAVIYMKILGEKQLETIRYLLTQTGPVTTLSIVAAIEIESRGIGPIVAALLRSAKKAGGPPPLAISHQGRKGTFVDLTPEFRAAAKEIAMPGG